MLSVNNLDGDEEEIDSIRKRLESVIEGNFDKVRIPVSWLLLSLYIRSQKCRTLSLVECEKLARSLNITQNLQDVLWFFHHCIGLHLYYPDILGDTLICDIQVVFDSASNLIRHIYELDNKPAQENFRKMGRFSLEDVMEATSKYRDNLIPFDKLVELLAYLGMLTLIPRTTEYFMPCVLKSARDDQLEIPCTNCSESGPAPLIIYFKSGYLPMGIFPAMITKLTSDRFESWNLICDQEGGLWKNKIQFEIYYEKLYYRVFLLSYTRFIKIAFPENCFELTDSLCAYVRGEVKKVVDEVTKSRMPYKFGFAEECPKSKNADHLCLLEDETALAMVCCQPTCRSPVKLALQHKIWFSKGNLSPLPSAGMIIFLCMCRSILSM